MVGHQLDVFHQLDEKKTTTSNQHFHILEMVHNFWSSGQLRILSHQELQLVFFCVLFCWLSLATSKRHGGGRVVVGF